jgi:hypothetical protein
MREFISWFGTFASILGSFLVAMQYLQIGYVAFIFGSASWLYIAYVTDNKSLLVLNTTFFVANIIGIYNAFFA